MSENIIGKVFLRRYRVDAFIASGGVKTVYKAWDLNGNFPLALKMLHADLSEDPVMLRSFQRDANAIKKLNHPNIVRFYGLERSGGTFFMLEEYIDGPSLKDVLKERKVLPVEEALVYFKAICDALGLAHANDIVHCDVKPGNVMIKQSGEILLTDFGIARHAGSDSTTTLAGAGTPGYMAPEQVREDAVTVETDIYAMGVMLFEMLTGQRPFRGNEQELTAHGNTQNERIRYAHLKMQPPDPRSINPKVDVKVAGVVLKALAKDPKERYHSTRDFLGAICASAGIKEGSIPERAISMRYRKTEEPVNPTPLVERGTRKCGDQPEKPGLPGGKLSQTLSRNKVGVYISVAGGFLLLFVLLMIRPPAPEPPPIPASATITGTGGRLPAPTISPQPTQVIEVAPTFTMLPRPPAASPKPSATSVVSVMRLVFAAGDVGKAGVFITDADGSNERKVNDLGCMDDAEPSLSPVKNLLVFQEKCNNGQTYDLVLVDAGTLQRLDMLTNDPKTEELEPDWSPDGSQVVYHSNPAGKKAAEVGDLHIIELTSRQDRNLHVQGKGPAWSPDGKKIAFTSNVNEKNVWQIYVLDLEDLTVNQITRGEVNSRWPAWSPDGRFLTYNTAQGAALSPTGIWVVPAAGGTPEKVTPEGEHGRPAWSETSWITYYTNQDGIYMIRKDGSGVQLLRKRNAVICMDWPR